MHLVRGHCAVQPLGAVADVAGLEGADVAVFARVRAQAVQLEVDAAFGEDQVTVDGEDGAEEGGVGTLGGRLLEFGERLAEEGFDAVAEFGRGLVGQVGSFRGVGTGPLVGRCSPWGWPWGWPGVGGGPRLLGRACCGAAG